MSLSSLGQSLPPVSNNEKPVKNNPDVIITPKPSVITQETKDSVSGVQTIPTAKVEPVQIEFVDKKQESKPTTNIAPTESELKKGGVVIKADDKGTIVSKIQDLLTKSGFPVKSTGEFGKMTEDLVKGFQKMMGIQSNGHVGKQTLEALEQIGNSSGLRNNVVKKALVQLNIAESAGEEGTCFKRVANAVEAALGQGGIFSGLSAYKGADQMAHNSRFKEINVDKESLKHLPAGAIVVWPNNPETGSKPGNFHGHISVSSKDGEELSWFKDKQMLSHYAHGTFPGHPPQTPRVFLPIK